MTAKRSPARPVFIGSTTLSTAAVATAASMALPPFIRIWRPACAASGWLVANMPCWAITSARPWAAQPSALSPLMASQAGGLGSALQTDSSGIVWATAAAGHRAKANAAAHDSVLTEIVMESSFRLDSAVAHCPCLLRAFGGSRPSTPLSEAASSCRGRERLRGLLCHLEEGTPSYGRGFERQDRELFHGPTSARDCRRASIRLRRRRRSLGQRPVFLRQVVPHAARDEPVLIFTREFAAISRGFRMGRAVG